MLSRRPDISLGPHVFMGYRSKILAPVEIGAFTGIAGNIVIDCYAKAKIGKYCSIADGVTISYY